MKKIKQRLKKFGWRLSTISAEILLISGAFFIVAATATFSVAATAYVIGAMLSALGFFIAKDRR